MSKFREKVVTLKKKPIGILGGIALITAGFYYVASWFYNSGVEDSIKLYDKSDEEKHDD